MIFNLIISIFVGTSRASNKDDLLENNIILTSYAVVESCFRKQQSGFQRKGNKVYEKSLLHQIEWDRIILDEGTSAIFCKVIFDN
jgi:DNA repair protein RAD16